MTVFFTGAFLAGAATGFFTTVDELASLLSLVVLALPFPIAGRVAAGAGVLLPRPAPVAVDAGSLTAVIFLVAAAPLLAFSTMLATISAALPCEGTIGLRGETGRARKDF